MRQKFQKQIRAVRMLSVPAYLRRLNGLSKNDSLRGNLLITLGWIFDQRSLKSKSCKDLQKKAKLYFRQALWHKSSKREALRGLATVFMHEGKYTRALAYYRKAHRMKKGADTYNDLGNLYRKLGQIAKARQYYEKALSLARSSHDDFLASIAEKNLATMKRA